VIVCNFTPVPRYDYRVGVPSLSRYEEILNSDADVYGGGNVGNLGGVDAEPVPMHGHDQSIALTLPPLATSIFQAGQLLSSKRSGRRTTSNARKSASSTVGAATKRPRRRKPDESTAEDK
ncbi:MAG TPA: alpha amylase C-terminal domain-containing protein, partial [Ktedonobacterales bacterium]|nr:alpha amylase C-terminal domain-containing protein [Ktedonobacterales bacterium]